MEVRDYNGNGEWSVEAVRRRYLDYCGRHGQTIPRDLQPQVHVEGDTHWIYPIMEAVIDGIRDGDPACVELGVEFIESAHKQPFGRILHAKVARVLRPAALRPEHITRLRARILAMLISGQVPHEYRDYAKLLRRIGLGDGWAAARARVDESNPYVMRLVDVLVAASIVPALLAAHLDPMRVRRRTILRSYNDGQ